MPLTVGTAGHIDHGKTALVEALTGKNTDRLPEEHERGISIDLGYAPLELPDGTSLSVVDVPGHERFVRTMVAGASGIDLFLLVIDAGEGARPQTHEHLSILRLLGIEHGVVALTKADAVEEETLELARVEAEELVPGAPVVATSARTGAGLDELRAALAEVAARVARHDAGGPARLHVDRSFTLRGIGTVATGTLWSGTIGEGDELSLEPRGRTVRVRSVQVHDRGVERAEAGQRVAASLPGVERRELRRGDVLVTPGALRPSFRLDVMVEPLGEIPPRVMLHHGTAETAARVARAGDRFAQLRLSRPVVAARGDRIVLRAGTTVGGGVVLDPNAAAARRPRPLRGARARRDLRPCARPRGRRVALVRGMARGASRRPRQGDRRRRPARSRRPGSCRRVGKSCRPAPGARAARREALPARRRPRARRARGGGGGARPRSSESSRCASRTPGSRASSRSRAGSCGSGTASLSHRPRTSRRGPCSWTGSRSPSSATRSASAGRRRSSTSSASTRTA